MKRASLIFILLLISNVILAGNPNRTYHVKYILDSEGYAVPSEATVTVTPTKIYVNRNGQQKFWECVYKGVKVDQPDANHKIKFHTYYLTNKHVYITISDYKLVKHNGKFYYRFVFDGQVQLAI